MPRLLIEVWSTEAAVLWATAAFGRPSRTEAQPTNAMDAADASKRRRDTGGIFPWFGPSFIMTSQCEAAGAAAETSSRAQSRLPIPASAITQPIGQGVPSAKAPTSAEPMMPLP
jgi:hypothetical protein